MKQSKLKFSDVLADLKLDFEVETAHSWLAHARFLKESLDSIEITTQLLRHIKSKLSEQTNIPLNSLEFAETLDNTEYESTVIATFRLQISGEQKGKPQLSILPLVTTDGVEYKDMIARLTIHPINEDGSQITMEKISE
ncbi:MAG: hypothetical protein OEM52_15060 [bacterium]|nr:hypothetical protein [bacterium]